ncbi:MAG: hypothetical protein JO316_09630 [Abitibacteriaceae bacterium]|nr:hypothetical protein [Abditibacteriaceae bacterium]
MGDVNTRQSAGFRQRTQARNTQPHTKGRDRTNLLVKRGTAAESTGDNESTGDKKTERVPYLFVAPDRYRLHH